MCVCVCVCVCVYSIVFYSILGCVLPLQEVAISQNPPSFSVLCSPCPYHSLLPHNIISPMTLWSFNSSYTFYLPLCASKSPSIIFHSGNFSSPFPFHISYVLDYVTLVLCLMMVLRILSSSLTLSIFLSIARWLVSSFFTNGFVRDHAWHPYVIAGKTHWLKTFLFRLMGRYLSRKISLYIPKTLHPACILIETSCFALFSFASVCPRYL